VHKKVKFNFTLSSEPLYIEGLSKEVMESRRTREDWRTQRKQ